MNIMTFTIIVDGRSTVNADYFHIQYVVVDLTTSLNKKQSRIKKFHKYSRTHSSSISLHPEYRVADGLEHMPLGHEAGYTLYGCQSITEHAH